MLQFDNIDRAELYGFEVAGGWRISETLSLDASISHVRGRNKDSGGDLYRIAPLHGMFDLAYRHTFWEAHLEWVWADSQSRVSTMQDETPTPGHGIVNLRAAKTFADALRLEADVVNLFDKRFAEHLGGVNRVMASDVAVGERIPSAGRHLRLMHCAARAISGAC